MDNFIGQIILVAFNYAPVNYMLCQGQILNIRDYQALFALLGNIYGGNAPQTFALPDLRGRTPIGTGPGYSENFVIGQQGGQTTTTLSMGNLPIVNGTSKQRFTPSTNENDPFLTILSPSNNTPINNMQPYLTLNYAICVQGYWPSRP